MDMMKGHIPELFELALEGRLTPQQKERFEKHIASCKECAADYEFALKVRSVLDASMERGVEPARLAQAEAKAAKRASGDPIPGSLPWIPVLAGSAIVALFVLWIMPSSSGGFGWLSARSAVELSGAAGGSGYREQETRIILRAVGSSSYQPGVAGGSSVTPLLVTDFENYQDLSGVVFMGNIASRISAEALWGSSSLKMARMADPEETLVLEIPLQTYQRCPNPAAVSVWAFCSSASRIGLEIEVSGGGAYTTSPLRDIEAGKWMWAVFEVPDSLKGTGMGVEGLRFQVKGKGDLSLDRVEIWCGR